MWHVSTLMLISTIFYLSACEAGPLRTDMRADVPAHIVNPTFESRAELLQFVRQALNGSEVTIADDALTSGNLLIIEPKHLAGRDFRRPVHFRLMLSGSDCVLVHQGTDVRMELTQTTCAAE